MPRRLLARCSDDSIREFLAAASARFNDGLALAGQGRRTAAIYLWGYTAEITLKAAYFRLLGIPDTQIITVRGDIRPAIDHGRRTFGIAWPPAGEGHNVRAWAELLVAARAAAAGTALPIAIARGVQRCGQRIEPLWRETLRYRKNHAYAYEMNQVRESAEWLLVHSSVL